MARPSLLALAAIAFLPLLAGPAVAEPPAAGGVAPPPLASDADANAALAKFQEDFKAKGLTGDDRLSQRDYAMGALAKVQHRLVVDALAGVTRNPDGTLRTIAVIYLGDMKALPGLAGPKVVAAMKKDASDPVLVMSGLQSLGSLRYLGAKDDIRKLLESQDWAIRKCAILAAGETRDMRLIEDVLKVVGIEIPTGKDPTGGAGAPEQSGGKEVTEEGYSWEGAEAHVDTGTAGDGDQKAAEAEAKAKMAANKAAAEKSSGGGSGGGGGGVDGGSAGGRGGAARTPKELLPAVIKTLNRLTGRSFGGPRDVKKWMAENREPVAARKKALDDEEKAQKEAAAAK